VSIESVGLVVLGSTNWDICMYLPSLPTPGETVAGGKLNCVIGGKGANQAVAGHRTGLETSFISCIGDDDIGRGILSEFERFGLNTRHIVTVPDTPTGTACIFVDEDGENCIGLTAGANRCLSADVVASSHDAIVHARVLLMQLEVPLTSVIAAAKIASAAQTQVILNPAPARELPDEIYPCIDILTPNRGELGILSGMSVATEQEVTSAARSLLSKGVACVLVTLGKEGVLLVDAERSQSFRAYAVNAADTTAAGDVFSGALAAKLVDAIASDKHVHDLLDNPTIQYAMAAAAISVTREGAIPSIPQQRDVESFLLDQQSI